MRVLDFTDGFSSASAPTTTAVSVYSVSGSRASPNSIVDVTGITASTVSQIQFVKGSSGAVDIIANPQISAGTTVGQMLILIGRSDTDTILLEDSNGLSLNGPCTLVANSMIQLVWDGTNWVEVTRNDI